jgi:hypothetical protein
MVRSRFPTVSDHSLCHSLCLEIAAFGLFSEGNTASARHDAPTGGRLAAVSRADRAETTPPLIYACRPVAVPAMVAVELDPALRDPSVDPLFYPVAVPRASGCREPLRAPRGADGGHGAPLDDEGGHGGMSPHPDRMLLAETGEEREQRVGGGDAIVHQEHEQPIAQR